MEKNQTNLEDLLREWRIYQYQKELVILMMKLAKVVVDEEAKRY